MLPTKYKSRQIVDVGYPLVLRQMMVTSKVSQPNNCGNKEQKKGNYAVGF
jgi:hypothetical protein